MRMVAKRDALWHTASNEQVRGKRAEQQAYDKCKGDASQKLAAANVVRVRSTARGMKSLEKYNTFYSNYNDCYFRLEWAHCDQVPNYRATFDDASLAISPARQQHGMGEWVAMAATSRVLASDAPCTPRPGAQTTGVRLFVCVHVREGRWRGRGMGLSRVLPLEGLPS